MQGYKLFFYEVTREGGLENLGNYTYELAVHEVNFTGLKPYTKYSAEVQGFNNFGDGPLEAVEVFAEEGSKQTFLLQYVLFNIREVCMT